MPTVWYQAELLARKSAEEKKDQERLEKIKIFNFGLEQEQVRDQLREFGMIIC